jgi:hypothetical protein
MKAWLLHQIGSLDHLKVGEAPEPVAAPGEAVLRVEFAALNPADRYLALGQYPAKPALPHVLGPGLLEGLGSPRSPVHWIVCVLQQVRTLLVRQTIGMHSVVRL